MSDPILVEFRKASKEAQATIDAICHKWHGVLGDIKAWLVLDPRKFDKGPLVCQEEVRTTSGRLTIRVQTPPLGMAYFV
jgi:hypothetical protein